MDDLDTAIVAQLQENARISLADLGRSVNLSPPALGVRLRRLEETGVITGYHATVDPAKLGLPMMAFIRVSAASDVLADVVAVAERRSEVVECHRGTGADCFILKVVVSTLVHLENLIDDFTRFGQVTTSLVLSSPIVRRSIAVSPRKKSRAHKHPARSRRR